MIPLETIFQLQFGTLARRWCRLCKRCSFRQGCSSWLGTFCGRLGLCGGRLRRKRAAGASGRPQARSNSTLKIQGALCVRVNDLEVLVKTSRDEHHLGPGNHLAGVYVRVQAAGGHRLTRRQRGGVAAAKIHHTWHVDADAEIAAPGRRRVGDDVVAAPDGARLVRDRLRRKATGGTRRSARYVKLGVAAGTEHPPT